MKINTYLAFAGLILSSCTFNVSMAHTEGTATDVIDDTQSTTPTVDTHVSMPAI